MITLENERYEELIRMETLAEFMLELLERKASHYMGLTFEEVRNIADFLMLLPAEEAKPVIK
jgi:hypothetical protein